MSKETYYSILGVDEKCSPADIKNAYYGLMKKYHPDKNKSNEDICIIKINKAYEILKKSNTRALYDDELRIHRKNMKKNTFMDMKEKSQKFLKSMDTVPPENHKLIKIIENVIEPEPETNFDERLQNLEMSREQEYIESIPNKLMEEFDNKKFNELVEETMKKIPSNIIKHTQVHPHNLNNINNMATLDDSMCNVSPIDWNECSGIEQFTPQINEKENLSIEEMLRQREIETNQLNHIKINEFKKNECFCMDDDTPIN